MLRRTASFTLATGAALALLTSTAGASPAAESADASILACHNADTPTRTAGGWVHGKGWGSCQQHVGVYIQRLRAWGWEYEGDGASYDGPGSAVASWNCSGTGHYTYRTLVVWRDGTGPQSATSPEVRYEC
ncbi:hypothetical protein UK23_03170 [Lentzea aerocolonigenes]|uniref:Secreted protein n=1 Tax=Lentzea aerocolonigenes TaxID=68170 RepID=A0A0F0HD18_LENAE|nr:hypothetical protein [Lentzea aerocolonigenes]KJK52761.1 hypothetical protein UK23_03170 [Lentzea aerocolonigenes]